MAQTLDNYISVLIDDDLTRKSIDDDRQPPQDMASRDYVSDMSHQSVALGTGADSAAQSQALISGESPTSGLPHTKQRSTVKALKSTKDK
jgi:hypothetical protein